MGFAGTYIAKVPYLPYNYMTNESTFNNDTHQSAFTHKMHHAEVIRTARVNNDAPAAYGQKLAAKKGTNGAKKLLLRRFKKTAK